MAFKQITIEAVRENETLRRFLSDASVQTSRRGDGVFIDSRGVATGLETYGIVLPRGGMIIPDENVEGIQAVVSQIAAEEKEQEEAALVTAYCLLSDLAEGIPHISITEESEHSIAALAVLSHGVEAVRVYRDMLTDIDEAQQFIEVERHIWERRAELLPAVLKARDLLEENAGETWRLQALQFGQDQPFEFYKKSDIERFEAAHKVGLLVLSPVTNDRMVFEWTDEDISRLAQIVNEWVEETRQRRGHLWNLFVEANGVFTKTEVERSAYAGKSFGRAMSTARTPHYSEGKHDEWVEITYFIGGEQVTGREYEWLRSKYSALIPLSKAQYRLPDDLGTIKPAVYPPGERDILVLSGKTGQSRRGVAPTGIIWQGSPEKLPDELPPYSRVGKVELNGEEVASGKHWHSLIPVFRAWQSPRVRALRALKPEINPYEIERLLPELVGERESHSMLAREAIALASAY